MNNTPEIQKKIAVRSAAMQAAINTACARLRNLAAKAGPLSDQIHGIANDLYAPLVVKK